jgi:dipeptidyl aminopeptidase/acylaminoacyl peptidase
MRQQEYPGSDFVFEETLAPGSNYDRYIVSYQSEELKLYALLTVPRGAKPETGWPVIIFNHGYIPPRQYRTTERYVAHVDNFARSGYIVLRSDYRGHGNSDGFASGAYGSPEYTIDVLNAVGAIKRFPDADPKRIGMWGHSMGGYITLRSMVVSRDIKAGVIWAGVVARYPDLLLNWDRVGGTVASTRPPNYRRGSLSAVYGFSETPQFWAAISANAHLDEISGPLQLHHGTGDEIVPHAFSALLNEQMTAAGQTVEFYSYPGDDHNLSGSFGAAMRRSLAFFDAYLKGQ